MFIVVDEQRGKEEVFLAIGGPRRIFHSIPRNHSTSPFKEKFQIARVEKPVWTNRPFRLFSNYFSPSPGKFFFLRIFNRPIVGINFHMLKFFILPLLWGTFFSFFFFFLFRQILERGYLVLVRLKIRDDLYTRERERERERGNVSTRKEILYNIFCTRFWNYI